jgi:HEAT repeat protein
VVLEWTAMDGARPGRRREVGLAGHRGDVAAAEAAVADEDPGVRATALGALARAGGLTAGHLVAALRDPSPEVRRRAAEETARCPPSVRRDVTLVPLLGDTDALVVEAAAFALGELDPPEPESVDALIALARGSDDALLREAAVAALGSLGDPAGRDAVLAATTDVSTVRRRAVLALAAFEGPEVEAALQRLTTDRDRQVRQWAEDLLRGWGTQD